MRKAFIYIVMTLAFFSISSHQVKAETTLTETTTGISLKVMTWNIHSGINWSGQYDLDDLAKFILEVNPDIVGFQEVDSKWSSQSHFEELPQELAKRLAMHYAYSASLERNNGYFGNLILSKYPIVQIWAERLPGSLERRSFAFTQLLIGGKRVNFITTHLGLSEADRLQQVAGILETSRLVTGPVIITGDFNAGPEDPAVALLKANYHDCWDTVEPKPKGTFRVKSGEILAGAIDFVLTSPDLNCSKVLVYDNYFSDHLPVTAEIFLKTEPSTVTGNQVLY